LIKINDKSYEEFNIHTGLYTG